MRILFISDLHLNESDPVTTDRFFSFMAHIAPDADALYVMGDLFHVWLGDALIAHHPFAKTTIDQFKRLSSGKTRIFIMVGNRDFMLGGAFAMACGATMLPEQHLIQLGEEQALLLHGDELCTDDVRYQRARKILRSPLFKWCGDRLPYWFRRHIGERLRTASKAHKAAAPKQILDANANAIQAMFAKHHVKLMIHGHTHRPTDEHIDTPEGRARRIVLSDWQQDYGYLEWCDGQFKVQPWPR